MTNNLEKPRQVAPPSPPSLPDGCVVAIFGTLALAPGGLVGMLVEWVTFNLLKLPFGTGFLGSEAVAVGAGVIFAQWGLSPENRER